MTPESAIIRTLSDSEALLWRFQADAWPPMPPLRLARLEAELAATMKRERHGPLPDEPRVLKWTVAA